ncbi:hypothetical protein AB3M83_08995 [Microbacterium sp. 179-B 1A2 NHS]|uniref:hypothetical protein n=1 Tax=Microbacterium sp. 179-B 1A2 NHS TaxID=3142383 RepID=UPI0039A17027
MPLEWPIMQHTAGDMPREQQAEISRHLDFYADQVLGLLGPEGLDRWASPLWQSWELFVVADGSTWMAGFYPSKGGTPRVMFFTWRGVLNETKLQSVMQRELGVQATVVVTGPNNAETSQTHALLGAQARTHVDSLVMSARVGTVAEDYPHLAPYINAFLEDHPGPSKNVFIMMRFAKARPLGEAHATIKSTLAARGLHGVRADDRDYTGDVWSNIELYMALSHYGIAVFEDVANRDFNPNVSLELGYMLGQKKRVLLLKEQSLPTMPADVVHKLYRSWDAFDVENTVGGQVAHWFDNDIRI